MNRENPGDEYVDVREAAEILGVSLNWMYRHSAKYGITKYKFGHYARFKRDELKRWARLQRQAA